MKLPSEVIPKFIISLERDKERAQYLKQEVYPKITNYFKCKAFDGENDDPNPILQENNIFIAEHFISKCTAGQLGCFLSHFQIWKYISNNNIEMAIILEDDVKLYKNFNRVIDLVFDNLPIKFDYVQLFIHPDKLKTEYLNGNEGDLIPAEENSGTVAYLISLRGARRLIKLTQLLKIQAPVDKQIYFYIERHFIKGYMVKKPFLITQGEIMPNRAIYNNSFKSNVWYSKRLFPNNKIEKKYIKPAGFDEQEINDLDKEIEKSGITNIVTQKVADDIKQTETTHVAPKEEIVQPTSEVKPIEDVKQVEEVNAVEEVKPVEDENTPTIDLSPKIVLKEIEKLNEKKSQDIAITISPIDTINDDVDQLLDLSSKVNEQKYEPRIELKIERNEEDDIVSAIIGRLREKDFSLDETL